MCEIAAFESNAALLLVEAAADYLTMLEETKLPKPDRQSIYAEMMRVQNERLKEFVFKPQMILTNRPLQRLMQKQLGGFTTMRHNCVGVSLKARSDLLEQREHAYQAHMNWVLSRAPNTRHTVYGDVFGETIHNEHSQLLRDAASFFPEIASKCYGLVDYFFHLGWHRDRERYMARIDWLSSWPRFLILNGLDHPENSTHLLDQFASTIAANKRPLLATEVEQSLIAELKATSNVRLAISRMIVQYASSIATLPDFYASISRTLLIVGVCIFCNHLADLSRKRVLRLLQEKEAAEKERQRLINVVRRAEKDEQARLQKLARQQAQAARQEKERLAKQKVSEQQQEKKRVRNAARRRAKLATTSGNSLDTQSSSTDSLCDDSLKDTDDDDNEATMISSSSECQEVLECGCCKIQLETKTMTAAAAAATTSQGPVLQQLRLSVDSPEFKPMFPSVTITQQHQQQQQRLSLAQWFLQATSINLFNDVWSIE